MSIRLTNITGRKTDARVVHMGFHNFYFSYETCIAYIGPNGEFRLPNYWGPTTGRHINEMGLNGLEQINEEEFNKRLPILK